MTTETSRRSATSASKARSDGSAWRSSASSARERPAHSGWLAAYEMRSALPARIGGDVLPARDAPLDLRADEVTDVRVGEGGHACIDAEPLEGGWQDRRQRGRGGRVRVLVGRHVETLRPGCLEPGERGAGLAPDRPRAALEVRDLEPPGRAGRPDRRDRFVQRGEQPVALVAHVRRVQAPAPAVAVTRASTSAASACIPGA